MAVTVLAGLTVAVSDQRFLRGEATVVELANDVPTWAGWPPRIVMQLGTLPAALVVVAAVGWWRSRARGPVAAMAGFVAVLVAFRLDNVVKDVVERPRPPGLVAGLHVRESISGFGFPSGHATMAFALASSLHPVLPRCWRWLAWALAALVGLARMHVGVHWPVDVLGGAALGTAIGSAAWLLVTAIAGRGAGTPAAQHQR